jgi:hypothetical protein
MTLVVAGGLWAVHTLAGCAGESIPVGGIPLGEGGTGGLKGGSGPDDSADGTGGALPGNQGGRGPSGGNGSGAGLGAGAGNLNQGNAAEGGDPAIAGSAGSVAGSGLGGFAGTIAGYAGDAVDPSGGSFGLAGSAGFGGAGSGGTSGSGGVFGYAGDAATGAELIELEPPLAAPCAQNNCTGTFEWRKAVAGADDYYHYSFSELSADGRVVVGYGGHDLEVRSFRMAWETSRMWMLLESAGDFGAEASSYNSDLLAGANQWVLGNGEPQVFTALPSGYHVTSVSHDGSAGVVATDWASGSFVLGFDGAELVEGHVFYAVSGDGMTAGGERLVDQRAVIRNEAGDIQTLPEFEGWVPWAVYGLSMSGDVAVGYARHVDDVESAQAFRWEVGSSELTLLGIPDGEAQSIARDCNSDCSIIVGLTNFDTSASRAFVYDQLSGLHTLREYAFERAGVVAPGELFVSSIRISATGSRIAGGGWDASTPIVFRQAFTLPIAAPPELRAAH